MAKVKYKFKYAKIGQYYRPLMDILVKNKNTTLKYIVHIDSVADYCIFHSNIAKLLGLDLTNVKPVLFGGIKNDGKICQGYPAEIQIGVNNKFYKTVVLFSPDISPDGYPLVGQRGFFEHFVVQFDYANKHGYLK